MELSIGWNPWFWSIGGFWDVPYCCPLHRPPEVEKRIAGTKAKAVGAVLRHGHNSQRARARKAANEAGQSKRLKIVILYLNSEGGGALFFSGTLLFFSDALLLLPFGKMTFFTLSGTTTSSVRGGKKGLVSRLTRQDTIDEKVTSLFRRESEERGNKVRRGVDGNSSRGGGGRSRRGSKGREASAANSVERAGELRAGQRLTRQLSSSQDSLLPRRERRCQPYCWWKEFYSPGFL